MAYATQASTGNEDVLTSGHLQGNVRGATKVYNQTLKNSKMGKVSFGLIKHTEFWYRQEKKKYWIILHSTGNIYINMYPKNNGICQKI